jgi:hypothetical protein
MVKRATNHLLSNRCSALHAAAALVLAALMVGIVGTASRSAEENEGALLSRLKDRKHSLVDGIRQSEKENGVAISAKFEMKGETLMLSVYTARAGLGKDAEHNELIELIGDGAKATWTPEIEVFEDKQHLTRSAMQLTLVQLSKLTLADAVKKAEAAQPGIVYSVIPAVKDGQPVFNAVVATAEGKSVHLTVDGRTGKTAR